jgi:hypothetical protein
MQDDAGMHGLEDHFRSIFQWVRAVFACGRGTVSAYSRRTLERRAKEDDQ